MTTEKLIDLIRKLQAKADDASVTEAEAALYAAKVNELLSKHNLTESVLEIEVKEDISTERWDIAVADPWRVSIAGRTAELYFCSIYYSARRSPTTNKWKRSIMFVGKPHNLVVAVEIAKYLMRTTERLAVQYARSPQAYAYHDYSFTKARNGFARGCGERLAVRLYRLKQDQLAAAQPQRNEKGNPANLPALYEDEDRLIKTFMDTLNLKAGRGSGSNVGGGHAAVGRQAAETIGLNTQLKKSSSTMIG